MVLLCLIGEGIEHRADHAEGEGDRCRRAGRIHLLIEDIALDRIPAGAAIFLRPGRRDPALVVQNLLPADEIVLRQMNAALEARLDVLREGRPHEFADLFAERLIFGAEGKLHRAPAP